MLLLLVVDDLVKKFSGGGRVDGREDGMWWWGSLWDIRNEGEGKVVAALLSKQPHAFFFFV